MATFPIEDGVLPLRCPSSNTGTLLGLRPEHIALVDQSDWRGEVLVVEPTGADTYVVVKTAAGNVTVRTSPQTATRPGDAVGLQAAAEHVSWFGGGSGVRVELIARTGCGDPVVRTEIQACHGIATSV